MGTSGHNTHPVVLEKELLWAMNKPRHKDIFSRSRAQ